MARESKTGLAVIVGALTLACATLTTSVDFDRSRDFSRYRTFGFRTGTPARREFAQKRIEDVIGAALRARGLTPAADGKPDLNVFTHVVIESHQRIETIVWGYGCRWGGGVAVSSVADVPVGTLIVDIVDAKENCLVWQGRATDTISSDSETRERQLREAVVRMFEGFPPRPGTG
jgi:hypothetical protein